jgi:hypothetical protein
MKPLSMSRILTVCAAVAIASVATFAMALPGPSACLVVGVLGFDTLAKNSLTDSRNSSKQDRLIRVAQQAQERISTMFGPLQSTPYLVFFGETTRLAPFRLNDYGSTQFIGSRACVMIGPKGQNVDVVAHEMMHAELHQRLGGWRHLRGVPTWFDEGLAMQVDFRPRYDLAAKEAAKSQQVRKLTDVAAFFQGDEATVVQHYALAKAEVSKALAKAGTASLYQRLARVKQGESIDAAFAP